MLAFSLLTLASLSIPVSVALLDKHFDCPDGNIVKNLACCPFYSLADDLLANLFTDVCGEEIHETLRIAFHDSIGFSTSLTNSGQFGGTGADGSLLLFSSIEANDPANGGILSGVDILLPFLNSHNVTAGDLIQFATAVGLSTCPGAPTLSFFAGRPNAQQASPLGLIPRPGDSVDAILARMNDGGGFTAAETVALLASHSIARADDVDPTISEAPFDTTPFTFDSQFYLEVLLKGTGFPGTGSHAGESESPFPNGSGANTGEMRLQSDFALARDSRTACTWQGFINQQASMATAFQKAMNKLAIVGHVQNTLVDCSAAVPANSGGAVTKLTTYPASKSFADVEVACSASPFPSLGADPGPATSIPHCPPGVTTC